MFGHVAMVDLLIKRGADPFITADHMGTIREVAVQFTNQEVINFLDSKFLFFIFLIIYCFNIFNIKSN